MGNQDGNGFGYGWEYFRAIGSGWSSFLRGKVDEGNGVGVPRTQNGVGLWNGDGPKVVLLLSPPKHGAGQLDF